MLVVAGELEVSDLAFTHKVVELDVNVIHPGGARSSRVPLEIERDYLAGVGAHELLGGGDTGFLPDGLLAGESHASERVVDVRVLDVEEKDMAESRSGVAGALRAHKQNTVMADRQKDAGLMRLSVASVRVW